MTDHIALGIDIGGTNTVYGLVDKTGELLYENTISTRNYTDPKDLVKAIYTDVTSHYSIDRILGIGVGAPNGNSMTGNIEYAPNLEWKGIVPLVALFEDQFHKPTHLANDANAAAIGEMMFGVTKGIKDFVTITLGTGLGSGVIVDGELVIGHDGFAGEYGHIRVVPNGRLCGCGRNGCLETYASSTGVVRSIQELDSINKASSTLLSAENPNAKDVFNHAKQGDLFAQEIIEFTAQILGSSLADFACFSSPKAYVLFGGIAQSGVHFSERVKFHMEENMLIIYKNKIEIILSELHDKNAAVLGTAASLFWKKRT
jgi:glucokinase